MIPTDGPAGVGEKPHHEAISTGAAAFAFAARAFATAVIVCGLTYVLHWFDFGPIRELVTGEERAYMQLFPPKPVPDGTVNPIIFVDIDMQTLANWRPQDFKPTCSRVDDKPLKPLAGANNPASGTPRWLIAEITKAVLGAGAAAVFIDIDLRSRGPDGDALDAELKCLDSAKKILLPHYFETGTQLYCGTADKGRKDPAPIELDTGFDTSETAGVAVHAVVTSRGYGVIDGVCTSYEAEPVAGAKVKVLPAAMMYAIKLASAAEANPAKANSVKANTMQKLIDEPQWGEIQWLIGPELSSLSLPEGGNANQVSRLLYAHLSASQLIANGGISLNDIDLKTDEPAIVIIGSTHPGAGDIYSTPLGRIPGALVQANLGISAQLMQESKLSRWGDFFIETVMLGVACTIIGVLHYYFGISQMTVYYSETIRFCCESFLVVLVMLIFVFLPFALAFVSPFSHFMAIWRFGALSFILGALIVSFIELISHVGNCSEKWAHRYGARKWPHKQAAINDVGSSGRDPFSR